MSTPEKIPRKPNPNHITVWVGLFIFFIYMYTENSTQQCSVRTISLSQEKTLRKSFIVQKQLAEPWPPFFGENYFIFLYVFAKKQILER